MTGGSRRIGSGGARSVPGEGWCVTIVSRTPASLQAALGSPAAGSRGWAGGDVADPPGSLASGRAPSLGGSVAEADGGGVHGRN